ncbi:threonine aldolase family protein [Candidatus Halobonum tyrrellensis]|uniref:L-threonine aldolase n=1 Tax=Candidatus Halobonum tyrrellensis G22 TaxID=1324957 RepID=V4HD51_9EURY|nr:GntG family PLP-dependent aldolase [Candidatus Halobonum tyrrellensis]ESP88645.1 l-threonine aldolase [Candidatus Halobonum tyrrellensis G22]
MIDLRSDTVTTPSDEMREAAASAEVGDDVYRDDPTVNELERRAADLAGMDDALYVPSGTMGNQAAIRVHTDRGQELLCDAQAHVYKWELGGIPQLSQVQPRTLDFGERCVPTPEQVREGYVAEDLHRPGTGLLCLENTHNSRGGVAVPKERIDAAADAAHDLGVPVHLDGARFLNACVALDTDPEAMTESVDSVMFCLSKGLGAPVGSVLAGDQAFVDRARRTRKLFGGAMRQAGIIAAPGLLALENVDRLADDHANAARLAEGLNEIEGLSASDPDTNIVMVDSEAAGLTGEELSAACKERDVAFSAFGDYTCRLCTNLDVSEADVEAALDRIETAVAAA